MKYVLVYVAAGVVVLLSIFVYIDRRPSSPAEAGTSAINSEHIIHLKGESVRVTIASTPADRERGLGGRTGLAADEGMLFVFPRDGEFAFWMKDMLFSIDIVWIDASGKIVYIAPSVSPDTYPTAFDPHQSARYVLELPAGYAAAHGVAVGDHVVL